MGELENVLNGNLWGQSDLDKGFHDVWTVDTENNGHKNAGHEIDRHGIAGHEIAWPKSAGYETSPEVANI